MLCLRGLWSLVHSKPSYRALSRCEFLNVQLPAAVPSCHGLASCTADLWIIALLPCLQMQSRYNAFNPDAIRPARRVYVGGLPPTATDVTPA